MAGKSGRSISAQSDQNWKKRILSWEGVLVLLFLMVNLFCMVISPSYKPVNVLREMPKYLTEVFLLLPMAYILILGEIDLSVGATVCLSATTACLAGNAGVPFPIVLLIGILTGTACGLFNGIAVTLFTELPSMIVTLATMIIFRGVAEIALGSGGSVSLKNNQGFRAIAGKIGPVPYIFFVVIIAAIIFTFMLSKTTFGRKLYAIGSNRKASYFSGIHVQKIRLLVYSVAGMMAGISAMFLVSVLYGANTTTGSGFELDAIAMAVFGGISTAGGKGKLIGAIISAFIIICLRIGLGQINMNPQVILVILGTLLILAVMIPEIGKNMKRKQL
ncbi:ABC transporter permease [Clostridium boliviensis]|uniref:Autoinducer 2 import system permease protein LsrD n=1 Tax=Clostridium boliviensis TaxID=318465 RepID=A0ABU4GNW0_9CLOT|nr:ABC transporter permease [Clostridium boliviensis]MDW2797922.1 ABC transporter permease [Clostridium boliviensis]